MSAHDGDGEADAPTARGVLHPEGIRAARSLAAGVVHEINNVLGVILGNLHLGERQLPDGHPARKFLGEIKKAVEDGHEAMQNLSVIARDRVLKPRVWSLNELVERAIASVEADIESDLCDLGPRVSTEVWVAEGAIASAIGWLAGSEPATGIEVSTHLRGGEAEVVIEDDGPTPSEAELSSFFTPYAHIVRRPKAGLRLTKLADLAARSSGSVSAKPGRKGGVRITLRLPAVEDP